MQQTFELPIEHKAVILNSAILDFVMPQLAAAGKRMSRITRLAISSEGPQTLVNGFTFEGEPAEFHAMLRYHTGLDFHKEPVYHNRIVPLYRVSQCVAKVIGWSTDRGILENGRWDSQGTKLYEEDGEAATGVGKNKKRLIIDGIGDALVVLVNVLELTSIDAAEIAHIYQLVRDTKTVVDNPHYHFHKMRKNLTEVVDVVYECEAIDSPKKVEIGRLTHDERQQMLGHAQQAIHHANQLARHYDYSLDECFSLAWDEIKDRKGFLNADGVFIKEADA
ncbi:putative nucleotide pyrophosphohydrolase [Salmonella phage pSal-SNUABM-04]|nr:putative nucleotide pyrophosphohydrolase [Salmonella phage pSal-SNUABM-04]